MCNLIIDPFATFITSYNMFAPADYFCEDATKLLDTGDEFHIKKHMEQVSHEVLENRYNISITEYNNFKREYDKIIIIFNLNHINDPGTNNWNEINTLDDREPFQRYFTKLAAKLEKIKYNHIIFLDYHDRAVCSAGEQWFQKNFLPYSAIFKREYRRTYLYDYSNKVFSFPFLMFGSAPINSCKLLFEHKIKGNEGINECIWPGSAYNDMPPGKKDTWCNRQAMLNAMAPGVHFVSEYSNYQNFLNLFNKYKYFLHLNGHGQICKRMFEGLSRDSLMIMEEMDILFPFDKGDFFARECIFTYPQEYIEKINKLKNDQNLYKQCKEQQEYIINKYYNYNWINNYINSKLS